MLWAPPWPLAALPSASVAAIVRPSYDCPKPAPSRLAAAHAVLARHCHTSVWPRDSTCVTASAQPRSASRSARRAPQSAAGPPAWIEGRRRRRTRRSKERAPRSCTATRRRHEALECVRVVSCARLTPSPLATRCTPWRGTAQEGSSRQAPWTAPPAFGISTT